MYSKSVPYKDFKGNVRNEMAHFNLTIPEMLQLLGPFQTLFKMQESAAGPARELDTEEIMGFYNALETILKAAWGEPSEDGKYFRKSGRYDFEESALFPAFMVMMVTDTQEAVKFVNEIVPADMADLIKKAEVNLNTLEKAPETPEELRAQIARLQAQLPSTDAAPGAQAS